MQPIPKMLSYGLMTASTLVAILSMMLFAWFTFFGSLRLIPLNLERETALLLDAGLCLLFFVQHSVMVRKSFKQKMASAIHPAYHAAIYSLISGGLIFIMILFWQETEVLIKLPAGVEIGMRVMFLVAVAGFVLSARTMRGFEPYGIKDLLCFIRQRPKRPLPFTIKGAYRWVRHPLYLFCLIMIWSGPRLTEDRLLFNMLWTVWIIVGAVLEERDLTAVFGDQYREYQKQTPMLIPWRRPYPRTS